MPLSFRLRDYEAYRERVGNATYIDCTRRTDPAKIDVVWDNLRSVVDAYGAPWVLQLWTKDAAGVVEKGRETLHQLREMGTTIACQLTVTGLGQSEFEPQVPANSLGECEELLDIMGGPSHLSWRFDPLIPGIDNMERFERLASQAANLGITRLIINFAVDPGKYKRADRRIAALLPYWQPGLPGIDPGWKIEAATQIVEMARPLGLEVYACAESKKMAKALPGLKPPACGSYDWFASLSEDPPPGPPRRGSRPGCGCGAYFDVGSYGKWHECHGCIYCYAG